MKGVVSVRLTCPDCQAALRPDRTKMNVVVDVCPHEHGIFLDRGDIGQIVGDDTVLKIQDLVGRAPPATGDCPNCHTPLRAATINDVRARGCTNCGALWFNNENLREHVLGVRRRAYGPESMAARTDVMRDATAFYPGEIVAGILSDFELEPEI